MKPKNADDYPFVPYNQWLSYNTTKAKLAKEINDEVVLTAKDMTVLRDMKYNQYRTNVRAL